VKAPVRPAREKKPVAAAPVVVAAVIEERVSLVAEFTTAAPAKEPMPFAEPEPSPFAIDRSLPKEVAATEDFAGQAAEVPVLTPEPELEEEEEVTPLKPEPVESGEDEDDEAPAFFTISDEEEPDEEPALPQVAKKEEEVPVVLPGMFDALDDDLDDLEPASEKPAAGTKPRAGGKGQPELSFEGGPRGKFEGASPSLFEGEDLDVPAFLRKKR
jgi:hypothetical protein